MDFQNFNFQAFMNEFDGLLHVAIYCVPRNEVDESLELFRQWRNLTNGSEPKFQ